MQLPRCGVKDKVGAGTTRSKRFALQGNNSLNDMNKGITVIKLIMEDLQFIDEKGKIKENK